MAAFLGEIGLCSHSLFTHEPAMNAPQAWEQHFRVSLGSGCLKLRAVASMTSVLAAKSAEGPRSCKQGLPPACHRLQERERVWCSYDALAAAVSVCALVIAALRVDGALALWETLMHTALVGLAVALMVRRRLDGYSTWRNLAVVSRILRCSALGQAEQAALQACACQDCIHLQ
jgi:hypothetical protein